MNSKGTIMCPVCRRGKIVVKSGNDAVFSAKCPKCGAFADYDVKTMTAVETKAVRNVL